MIEAERREKGLPRTSNCASVLGQGLHNYLEVINLPGGGFDVLEALETSRFRLGLVEEGVALI